MKASIFFKADQTFCDLGFQCVCHSGTMELSTDDVGLEDGRLPSRGEHCSIKTGSGETSESRITLINLSSL